MANYELLKRVEAFQNLSEAELTAIDSFSTEVQYQYGDRLFKDGDNADFLWIVKEGLIDLRFDLPGRDTSEESTLSSLSENQIIGWSSFVSPFKYKLSAYCVSSKCRVVKIDREKLREFLAANPRTGYQVFSVMLKVVGRRFQRLQGTSEEAPLSLIKIKVHMGTCGISAGAREVMKTLGEEIAQSGRERIQLTTGSCMGKCWSEPNVTVEIQNEKPVVYQKMNAARMRRVFSDHILNGKVQQDWVLEGGFND